jgi:hypothetical protein
MVQVTEKLKRIIAQCTGHQHQHFISLPTKIIQVKAQSLFGNLSAIHSDPKVQSFTATVRWFERFKGSHGFHGT